MDSMTVEAVSVAGAAFALEGVAHGVYADVTFTERGVPWARVDVRPATETVRAVYPLYADGFRGDTRKRGQSGVMVRSSGSQRDALVVVLNRARRMFAA